ncbi:ATP-dependent chaperone ClpB [Marinithermus hydrothermalis DSM 14884]|uniref:ATP-dependent chaperone ClpB n=2 Tax=Marinithermus TaxID=186191 RepID=F2NMP5_MARHT|nr:ATP-dependent chaperone ClpB [Marinithermus hydrothermalis DSM 14884]
MMQGMQHLDQTLYYLGRTDKEGTLDLVYLQGPEGKLAVVFTTRAGSEKVRPLIPYEVGAGLVVYAAKDWRDKEVLFRLMWDQGARQYLVDLDPEAKGKVRVYTVEEALAYIESHKRNSSCL